MKLSGEEYYELLATVRGAVRNHGMSSIDERLLVELSNAESPKQELTTYLRLLASEFELGSDAQLKSVLLRFRTFVETEDGEPIEGIRLDFTGDESRRYKLDNLDFGPDPAVEELIREIKSILFELLDDDQSDTNR